jgi:hypothetical protein
MKTLTCGACVIFLLAGIGLGWFVEKEMAEHKAWSRGYTECMQDVVGALAKHDEVRLGNLVVSEPNTTVTDTTFFVVDPNQFGAVIDAVDVTVTNNYFSSVCDDYEYPE